MKEVYIARDPSEAHFVRAMLEEEGIEAMVQGENLFALQGGVPMSPDTLPSVWVVDDSTFSRAVELVSAFRHGEGPNEPVEEIAEDAWQTPGGETFPERTESGNRSGPLRMRVIIPAVIVLVVAVMINLPPLRPSREAVAENNAGTEAAGRGDYYGAVLHFSEAIRLAPGFPTSYFNRGLTHAQNGRNDLAITDYTQAVKLRPDYAIAYRCRAAAHRMLKDYDAAWADVKMCRQLGRGPDPGFIEELARESGRSE